MDTRKNLFFASLQEMRKSVEEGLFVDGISIGLYFTGDELNTALTLLPKKCKIKLLSISSPVSLAQAGMLANLLIENSLQIHTLNILNPNISKPALELITAALKTNLSVRDVNVIPASGANRESEFFILNQLITLYSTRNRYLSEEPDLAAHIKMAAHEMGLYDAEIDMLNSKITAFEPKDWFIVRQFKARFHIYRGHPGNEFPPGEEDSMQPLDALLTKLAEGNYQPQEKLVLTHTKDLLGNSDAIILATFLSLLKPDISLTLDLSDNNIGFAGCKALAELFAVKETKIAMLNLEGNPVTPAGEALLTTVKTPASPRSVAKLFDHTETAKPDIPTRSLSPTH